jgi:hypothetical protein
MKKGGAPMSIESYAILNRRARIERSRHNQSVISLIIIGLLALFVYITSLKAVVGFFS